MPYGSNAAKVNALRGNFGTQRATAAPGTLYVALLRQATSGQEGTTLGSEPDATGNYARLALSNVDASWSFGADAIANAIELRFAQATGTYSITDPLNQWAVYDNNSGGTCIAFGALTTPITVTGAGDVPVIPIGDLDLVQAA